MVLFPIHFQGNRQNNKDGSFLFKGELACIYVAAQQVTNLMSCKSHPFLLFFFKVKHIKKDRLSLIDKSLHCIPEKKRCRKKTVYFIFVNKRKILPPSSDYI